jgi:hypothetical protein
MRCTEKIYIQRATSAARPPQPDLERRRRSMAYSYKMIDSPVGKLKLVASDQGLAAILWETDNPRASVVSRGWWKLAEAA